MSISGIFKDSLQFWYIQMRSFVIRCCNRIGVRLLNDVTAQATAEVTGPWMRRVEHHSEEALSCLKQEGPSRFAHQHLPKGRLECFEVAKDHRQKDKSPEQLQDHGRGMEGAGRIPQQIICISVLIQPK